MGSGVFRPGGLELTKKAADIIGLCPGDRVLDIGCGPGMSLCFLRDNYGIEPYGADISPAAAAKAAAALGENRIFCADACSLPFEGESFRAIFMECVLTLINEAEAALSEAARLLSRGGHLVISALCGEEDGLVKNGRLSAEKLRQQLEALGFELQAESDESAALRRFVAEVIFEYDSIDNYIAHANCELGGSVLSCAIAPKATGYRLFIAKKL